MTMGEVSWRRIFAISSLIVSFLLVVGSIYLHVQHKHHLGRLNRRQHVDEYDVMADKDCKESSELPGFPQSSSEFNSLNAEPLQSSESYDYSASMELTAMPTVDPSALTKACMQCVCETITECRPAECFPYASCGLYRISLPYWLDAGKPLAIGPPAIYQGNDIPNFNAEYHGCVNNRNCSERAVAAVVNKYARDCNRDGKIDCRDHIALHVQGPSGCLMNELPAVFESRMENCLAKLA